MTINQIPSSNQIAEFHEVGYHFAKQLFGEKEIELLRARAKNDREMDEHAYDRGDGEGGQIRLSLWNQPGEGIYGAFARSQRMVQIVQALLNDEPYHYHSKMIMKEAKIGGAWAWHQDYGYWYQNAVLKPDLISAFVAVDAANQANGCLQVIPQSHKYGRIDHIQTGEQAGADLERVQEIEKREGLQFVEMEPGDVIFFHANLLHRSDQNTSEFPRWSMVCCYNVRSNSPYKESRHPCYSPLSVLDENAFQKVMQLEAKGEPNRNESAMQWHQSSSGPSANNLKTTLDS